MAPVAALAPGQAVGSYLLVERLGAGGIGEVWKARDRRLNRVVALKFIATERPGSSTARDLLREARAASALNNPNIITIFEVGESDGGTYLAMEFVEGETLRARLQRPPLPLEEAMEIATQVAAGLAAAHKQGIVHRDLKPENIMLRVDGYVKLVDFGLAKVLSWAAEETSDSNNYSSDGAHLVGTVNYMSPEQARGKAVEAPSDVFSFGIVLYEMLAAEHPFRSNTPIDTLQAILSKEPPPLESRMPGVSAELSGIVARALRKVAEERFPSAVALADELRRVRSQPVPPTAEAAPAPLKQKPRWLQAVGATLIATLLLAAGWFSLKAPRENISAPQVQSVAVLGLEPGAGDERASLLAQGLNEELGGALASVGLRVMPATSVRERGASGPRAMGEQLGVDAVLEGSVRSYGSKFKVHVELTSARTGFQIWTGTFTVEGEDLLNSEQRIAAEIAAQIRGSLGGAK
jgi:TolB-like protein/tRNA A-37 threonylcarbamoyl transferase component Bud32